MKKFISVLISVCLLLSLLPLWVFTASAATSGYYTYTVSNGEATITDVHYSISGDVTIPSNLGGSPVTAIGYWAFYGCDLLTSITIPNGVTSIEERVFSRCDLLTSINVDADNTVYHSNDNCLIETATDTLIAGCQTSVIPNYVTTIGNYAFEGCDLTSITLPNNITSIGNYAFEACTSLTSITLPNSVTSIGNYAFMACGSLTSITIPNGVTSIGHGAFENCGSLTSITIPNSVTSIGYYAFEDCTSLTSITFPNSITSIEEGVFMYCGLTSITIPNGVTSIGSGAFYCCESLASITLPNSVTSIRDNAFVECYSLTSITLPNSVTSIEDKAFYLCHSLTDVYYTGTQAQWDAIDIREKNDSLTSATIHYNSTVPITPTLQYGTDRFTFGQDITGFAGETLNTLAVYTSADYDTSALTITSSDTAVVEIGEVTHGIGEYIPTGNEHTATIPLIFKSEGTATITLTSPEGVGTSVDVMVFTNPISPEHLLSSSWESQAITIMDDYLATATSAPDWIVRSYQSNPKFMVGAAGWEYMNFLAEPSSTATDMLNKKSYYTTIILNLLNSYISSDGVIEMMESNVVTDTVSIASNFAKIIQQCDELEWEAILNGAPFTPEQIDTIFKRFEIIDNANEQIGVIKDLLGHMANFEEGCSIAANYIGLTRVKDDIVVMLEQLKANTSDLYYKYALQETIDSIESTFSAYLLGVQNGTISFATDTITNYVDDAWQGVLKSNPYTAAALFGFKIGKPLTNMLMNTDATISNYYDFLALREVERSVIASFKHFRDEFYANVNETTSVNYIRAVSMYFNVQYICCDYVEAFNEIANRCPFAQLFYGRQESYESLASTWRETRVNVQNLEYTLFRLWVLELKKQYPDIYAEISDTVGDIYSTDLKNATVTAEYFSVEYTGEAFCPAVSVKINGSPLIEGSDYCVEYKDNMEVGRAKIIITPAEGSMFSGQAIGGFVITAPPFTKRYSLKDTGARINAYSLRSAMSQSSSDTNIPNVIVYNKDGVIVAAVENGEVTCHILPVVIYGDDVDIFMDNEEYSVDITSTNATTSHVELSSLDENGASIDRVVYTGVPNDEIFHNIYIDTDELKYANTTIEPTYTSKTQDTNAVNSITVNNGIALQETASLGEVVYIDATIGAGKKFLGWSSDEIMLNAPSETTTYFIMTDQAVTISAELALAGDIDRNDMLDTSDTRLVLQKIVGLTDDFTKEESIITDLNEDSKVNSADVRQMLLMMISKA